MPLRAVLVDDVDEMRHLLRTLLERDGRFEIVGEAADGGEAVTVVAAAGAGSRRARPEHAGG